MHEDALSQITIMKTVFLAELNMARKVVMGGEDKKTARKKQKKLERYELMKTRFKTDKQKIIYVPRSIKVCFD